MHSHICQQQCKQGFWCYKYVRTGSCRSSRMSESTQTYPHSISKSVSIIGAPFTMLLKCYWLIDCSRHRCMTFCTTWQAGWRGQQGRRHVQQIKAAVVLQAVWRGRAVRAELAGQRRAALCLQAHWRGFVCWKVFTAQRAAIIKVCLPCLW